MAASDGCLCGDTGVLFASWKVCVSCRPSAAPVRCNLDHELSWLECGSVGLVFHKADPGSVSGPSCCKVISADAFGCMCFLQVCLSSGCAQNLSGTICGRKLMENTT
ncbi:hypothetical protein ILYODFUR_003315 [Ilyodon furcidens]|uniref:Uncharacterized protein n=1 Tax=Ilyodon furcidens TaxID=33524 RepID=A0ABV0UNN8_9TELE